MMRQCFKVFFTLLLTSFSIFNAAYAQNMLGYSDPQGNYYVNDGGKIVHLDHLQIQSSQPFANSIVYVTSTGNLMYYSNHEIKKLDISYPTFYQNSDKYLFYSINGSFSVFNGSERKFLGYIQQSPYAFSDSIAAFHDFSKYFYAYKDDRFIELEKNEAKKVIAGKNIIAYVNHINQFKIYYKDEKIDIDEYSPIQMKAGANTVAFIDNYNYMKIFYKGSIYELFNLPEINCISIPGNSKGNDLPEYCDGEIIVDYYSGLPVYQVGDDIVAFIDDTESFQVFYDGKIVVLDNQIPVNYEVKDNVLWFIDNNSYFKIFCNGTLTTAETFYPKNIKTDKDVVAYTDLDGRLKAFYKGEIKTISESIVLDFELNNTLIMYNDIPNKYKFFSLDTQ